MESATRITKADELKYKKQAKEMDILFVSVCYLKIEYNISRSIFDRRERECFDKKILIDYWNN